MLHSDVGGKALGLFLLLIVFLELLLPPHPLELVRAGFGAAGCSIEFEASAGMPPIVDGRIDDALAALGLASLPTRFGGLDVEQDWSNILPLAEQQLLVFARVLAGRPGFAFLDRPATALGEAQLDRVLSQLARSSIGYVVFAETEDRMDRYDGMLELKGGGAWEWKALTPAGRTVR